MTPLVARLTTALADRYAIERELGAGGMATVYLARGFPCAKARARPRRVNAPRHVLKDIPSFRLSVIPTYPSDLPLASQVT